MRQYDADFLELYEPWPRHEKKWESQIAWIETGKWAERPLHAELKVKAEEAAAHFRKTASDASKVPTLERWLYGRRWEDEYDTTNWDQERKQVKEIPDFMDPGGWRRDAALKVMKGGEG